MFPALKSLLALAALLLLLGGITAQTRTPIAQANLKQANGVYFLEDYGIPDDGSPTCNEGDLREIRVFGFATPQTNVDYVAPGNPLQVVQVASNDELIMCVEPANGPDSNVVFDTSGGGEWNDAVCGDTSGGGDWIVLGSDNCTDEEGVGDDALTVVDNGTNDLDMIAVTFSCNGASVQTITIDQDDTNDDISFRIMCKGFPANMQLGAIPTTVESSPALYNTSHSLIRAVITDASGNPVLPTTKVGVTASGCGVSAAEVDTLDERNEALFNYGLGTHDALDLTTVNAEFGIPPLDNFLDIVSFSDRSLPLPKLTAGTIEVDTNAYPDASPDKADGVPNHSEALVIFHAEGCAPGVYTVTFKINNPSGVADVEASVDITVIGPPAFITVSAAPTEVICGEKSEITVTATDINNRVVSDNTRIEVLTNWGGVFGGTGTSLTTNQPVNPLSSTTVEIFDGSGIAYLLTSPAHHGPYEVLAASTLPPFSASIEDVPRIVAQVTVVCTLAEGTEITAPDTGTGTSASVIRPPNTGDSGLAAGGAGNGTLLAVAGVTFFALAVVARRRARD